MSSGKLIVLYGINNLGKSTQARIITEKLVKAGKQASFLKYPLYDLEPTGPVVNDFLRNGNPHDLSRREFQFIMIMNRTQYDSDLRSRLNNGEWIVAEDYIGTGMAWGVGSGIDRGLLEHLNSHLVKEDIGILFEGERFTEATEKNHNHETDNELTENVRKAHDTLAKDYGWHRVNANDSIEEVTANIWNIIEQHIE